MSHGVVQDIARCRNQGHRFTSIWSDKTPMKHSLICVTCTERNSVTTYVAFGDETKSWGQWRRQKIKDED